MAKKSRSAQPQIINMGGGMPQVTTIPVGKKPGWFSGTPDTLNLISRLTPQQQEAFTSILSNVLGQVQQGGVQMPDVSLPAASFEPYAQKARTQFAQETVPTIAERFTALGGQRSSAFPQILGQQAAGLEESLAALGSGYDLQRAMTQAQLGMQKTGLGLQQQGQLFGLLGALLSPQFETAYRPGQASKLGSFFGGLGSAAVSAAPALASYFI